jgi:hypothetical protein
LAAVGVVAALTLVGISTGSGTTDHPRTTGHPSATASGTTTPDGSVSQWADDYGYVVIGLADATENLADAATEPIDLDEVYGAASQLADAAGEAQAVPPIPDADVDVHWQNALDDYEQAAVTLMSAIDNDDPAAVEEAGNLMSMGNDELAQATDALGS